MYLIPIIVPIFIAGARLLVATDWKRAMILLRDSLDGRYGDLAMLAPALPADGPAAAVQRLEEIEPSSGVRLFPTFDGMAPARKFWTRELGPLRVRLRELLAQADVVHGTMDDLFRPMTQIAFWSAIAARKPTLFVQDVDQVEQVRDRAETRRSHAKAVAYGFAYEKACRASVRRADLSLLKGKALMARYGQDARNPHEFHDTSHMLSEVVPAEVVEQRIASLQRDRPLRFVFCGRLVGLKGVADSVRVIEEVRARGGEVTLDIIGAGPEEPALRQQIERAGLEPYVKLTGSRPYGADLLRHLAEFDALLFTPRVDETPRMIFDGYAAGLPLVASDIPYVRERAEEEGATVLLPRGNIKDAAALVLDLARDRMRLQALARIAHRAGIYHAADEWYRRRAAWTHEAVDRHKAAARG